MIYIDFKRVRKPSLIWHTMQTNPAVNSTIKTLYGQIVRGVSPNYFVNFVFFVTKGYKVQDTNDVDKVQNVTATSAPFRISADRQRIEILSICTPLWCWSAGRGQPSKVLTCDVSLRVHLRKRQVDVVGLQRLIVPCMYTAATATAVAAADAAAADDAAWRVFRRQNSFHRPLIASCPSSSV